MEHVHRLLQDALTDKLLVMAAPQNLLNLHQPVKVTGTTDVVVAFKGYRKVRLKDGVCICFELKKRAEDAILRGVMLTHVLA